MFNELCARCHGNQALGDGPDRLGLSVDPTNLQIRAGKHTDGEFDWKIQSGRGEMPAWEDALEEDEVWHLVNYIQSLKEYLPENNPSKGSSHDWMCFSSKNYGFGLL